MNYLYDPEVAAKLAAYVNYISPVKRRARRSCARATRRSPTTR